VLGVRCLEELHHRLAGSLDLVCHATAYVEDGAEGNGSILTRKVSDFLPFLTLEHFEVLFIQPNDLAVQRIHDRHRHQDQVHIDLYRFHVSFQSRIFNRLVVLDLPMTRTRSYVYVLRGTLRQYGGHKPAYCNQHRGYPGASRHEVGSRPFHLWSGPAPGKRLSLLAPNGRFTSQCITAQPKLYSSRTIVKVKE